MKNSTLKKHDTFQDSSQIFKMLLLGSKMAKTSTMLLIGFSFVLMAFAEKNMIIIGSLFVGIVSLVVYTSKFLSLKTIEQKSYTQMSLSSSIAKFKTYLIHRKTYEIYFILIWAFSLFPFMASYLGSEIKALITVVLFITVTAILGRLGFIESQRHLKELETVK